MISTNLLMISAIHDLVLVSVVVANCSPGHGIARHASLIADISNSIVDIYKSFSDSTIL